MKFSSLFLYAVIGVWGFGANVSADHPTAVFGSERGGPLNTISAASSPRGMWSVGLRTELINSDPFSDFELASLAADGVDDVHSIDEIVSASASFAYGVSDKLGVGIRIPWVLRDNIREGEIEDGEAEAHAHGDAQGLGDLVVLANYLVYSGNGFDWALQGGIKTPTGETSESDGGERLETEFQPGSGSWDFLVGGAVGTVIGSFGVHANILYNATTEGSQDTEIGDALQYNLAMVFSPEKGHDHGGHQHTSLLDEIRWELMLELNGEQRWKNRISGSNEANSGGNVIYLSPGLRASYAKFSAFFSFGYPVVDDPNGWQSDIDFRLSGGIAIGY
jgi:hypothetical protein